MSTVARSLYRLSWTGDALLEDSRLSLLHICKWDVSRKVCYASCKIVEIWKGNCREVQIFWYLFTHLIEKHQTDLLYLAYNSTLNWFTVTAFNITQTHRKSNNLPLPFLAFAFQTNNNPTPPINVYRHWITITEKITFTPYLTSNGFPRPRLVSCSVRKRREWGESHCWRTVGRRACSVRCRRPAPEDGPELALRSGKIPGGIWVDCFRVLCETETTEVNVKSCW